MFHSSRKISSYFVGREGVAAKERYGYFKMDEIQVKKLE